MPHALSALASGDSTTRPEGAQLPQTAVRAAFPSLPVARNLGRRRSPGGWPWLAGGAIAAPRRARYTDAMWLGFGFFSLLPILFIFLVLHMVRIALRGTRGQRRPEAVWGRDYREQTAAREQPRRGRLENRVFRLAYRLGGRLTVSDLVVDLDFSIGEAESFLNQLVDSTRVTMEVRDDGLVYYEFPEIIARRHRGDGDLPSQV